MYKSVFLLALIFTGAAFKPQDDYARYCNARFSFCAKYPKSFQKGKEADNGDGAVFTSKDNKTEIRAYGSLAVEDFAKLEQRFTLATEKLTVTYKTMKADWFVFSGTDGAGNIVYQKTAKKTIDYFGDAGTPVFQTLRISYPPAQQKNYEGYCKVIAKSF